MQVAQCGINTEVAGTKHPSIAVIGAATRIIFVTGLPVRFVVSAPSDYDVQYLFTRADSLATTELLQA